MLEIRQNIYFFPKADLGIGLAPQEKHAVTPAHTHDFIEIALIKAGRGLHQYQQCEYEIQPGDVLVIHPHCQHAYPQVDNLAVINVLFARPESIPLLAEFASHPGYRALFFLEPHVRQNHDPAGRLRLTAPELSKAIWLTEMLHSALQAAEMHSNAAATAAFIQLLYFLCDTYSKRPQRRSQALVQIGRAVSHINSHLSSELPIPTLAALACMSERTFQRHFQRTTGQSVANYIQSCRLQLACDLLEKSALDVSTIARRVGYPNCSYFSRIFKTSFGIPARQWRRQCH